MTILFSVAHHVWWGVVVLMVGKHVAVGLTNIGTSIENAARTSRGGK